MSGPAGMAGVEIPAEIGVFSLIFLVFELIIEPITFFDEKEVDYLLRIVYIPGFELLLCRTG